MPIRNTICRCLIFAVLLSAAGCQTTTPSSNGRRARHEQSMEFTLAALREREARSADNLRATVRKVRDLLTGNLESARATVRRILEQD